MENENTLVKEYKVYKILNTNVFGFTALVHGLGNTFKSFNEYDQAEEWIAKEGAKRKEYVILEVFKKSRQVIVFLTSPSLYFVKLLESMESSVYDLV